MEPYSKCLRSLQGLLKEDGVLLIGDVAFANRADLRLRARSREGSREMRLIPPRWGFSRKTP